MDFFQDKNRIKSSSIFALVSYFLVHKTFEWHHCCNLFIPCWCSCRFISIHPFDPNSSIFQHLLVVCEYQSTRILQTQIQNGLHMFQQLFCCHSIGCLLSDQFSTQNLLHDVHPITIHSYPCLDYILNYYLNYKKKYGTHEFQEKQMEKYTDSFDLPCSLAFSTISLTLIYQCRMRVQWNKASHTYLVREVSTAIPHLF